MSAWNSLHDLTLAEGEPIFRQETKVKYIRLTFLFVFDNITLTTLRKKDHKSNFCWFFSHLCY